MLKSLNIKENDLLTIKEDDEKIVITKSKNKKVSLKNRFDNYVGKDLTKDFAWDEFRGREIW